MNFYYSGDEFRKAFVDIGTLRSILPKLVNVMALTATATRHNGLCHTAFVDTAFVIELFSLQTFVLYGTCVVPRLMHKLYVQIKQCNQNCHN